MSIKYVITDIDGVWTDGGMIYSESGEELKKFTTSDSVGVLILKTLGVRLIIMTGEDSMAVRKRAKKLGIEDCFCGVRDKLSLTKELLSETKGDLSEVAFIGDEINDHALLKEVGVSGCPVSAPDYTKRIVDFVVPTKGGAGAFRDFVLELVRLNADWASRYKDLL